jgi:hypothetical protein
VGRVECGKTGCDEAVAAAVVDAMERSAITSAAEFDVMAAALEATAALDAACIVVSS